MKDHSSWDPSINVSLYSQRESNSIPGRTRKTKNCRIENLKFHSCLDPKHCVMLYKSILNLLLLPLTNISRGNSRPRHRHYWCWLLLLYHRNSNIIVDAKISLVLFHNYFFQRGVLWLNQILSLIKAGEGLWVEMQGRWKVIQLHIYYPGGGGGEIDSTFLGFSWNMKKVSPRNDYILDKITRAGGKNWGKIKI